MEGQNKHFEELSKTRGNPVHQLNQKKKKIAYVVWF
jgi:hypothetical protein